MQRLNVLNKQFNQDNSVTSAEKIHFEDKTYPEVIDHHPAQPVKGRDLKWNGWGYKDSGFEYDPQIQQARVKGNRYMFGGRALPTLVSYFAGVLDLNPDHTSPSQ